MKTNLGLVEHVKIAYEEDWGYCLGAFGNVLTDAFLKQKMSQGGGVGAYNTRHKDYLLKWKDRRVSDCYGLVKSYIWWNDGNVRYNPSQDRNQEMAYAAATEKRPISTIPEIPGLVLWMKGHAGVYIGNGEFIECAGAPTGMRKGKIQDGMVVSGSRFTHWFKDTYITYVDPMEVLEEEEVPEWKYEGLEYFNSLATKDGQKMLDKEYWEPKINDNMPVWAVTLLLKRIHEDLKNYKGYLG